MPILKDDMPVGAAVEDYAKAIYSLQTRTDGGAVTTTALAERIGVTAGSASAMVKKLDTLGLVTHRPYRGVQLTGEGMRVALEVIRHHRLLELFLAEELGLPWDQVHQEAEVLEHVLSEELEAVISAKLGHPTHDPHGDPIPSPEGRIHEDASMALDTLPVGADGRFVRISDSDPEMLRYLAARGIRPGDLFCVVDRQPFGGPTFATFGTPDDPPPAGAEVHVLGGDLARAMRVQVQA